jgi:Domain of unknown function (DUF4160)
LRPDWRAGSRRYCPQEIEDGSHAAADHERLARGEAQDLVWVDLLLLAAHRRAFAGRALAGETGVVLRHLPRARQRHDLFGGVHAVAYHRLHAAQDPLESIAWRPLGARCPFGGPIHGLRAASLMPRISAFYGIVVTMYSSDHAPPHFHARYGEYEAQIVIDTGTPLAGQLPIRALRLIREWTELHRVELQANWERAQARTALASIDPLP